MILPFSVSLFIDSKQTSIEKHFRINGQEAINNLKFIDCVIDCWAFVIKNESEYSYLGCKQHRYLDSLAFMFLYLFLSVFCLKVLNFIVDGKMRKRN